MGFQKDALYALGYLAQAMLGSPTAVAGLACAPTSPASLQVTVGVGSIYEMETVDATAYGALGTDANTILKQGLLEAPTTLSITPPTTSGYSQVYLIEANYNDVDTNAIVLPYYNSANPSQPLNGPNGSGTQQNTIRAGQCVIALKAGAAAPTGSQVAPAADSGYTPLYLITVANGQTTITSPNISVYSGAPFIPLTLPQIPVAIQQQAANYAVDAGSANAISLVLPSYTTLTPGMPVRFKKSAVANTGACTITINSGSPMSLLWDDGASMAANDLPASCIAEGIYDGTAVRLNSPVGPTIFIRKSSGAGTYYGNDAGAVNALVVTTTTAITSLAAGVVVLVHNFVATNTSTTPTLNVDGLGAKTIVLSDGTAMAAGEIVSGGDAFFEYDGTNWRMYSMLPLSFLDARYPTITLPPSGGVFYVNGSTGNDSNNGLTTGTAFATIQGAINAISTKYLSVSGVTINVADGTYAGFTVNKSFIGLWNIIGDVATPNNCIISSPTSATNNGWGILVNSSAVDVSGFAVSSVYYTFQAVAQAQLRVYNCNWTAPSNSAYNVFDSYNLSSIFLYGNCSGSGNAAALFNASLTATIQLGYAGVGGNQPLALTLTGTPAFSVATANSTQGASITMISSVVTFTGGATGSRYSATLNGIITTYGGGASFIPGSTAGSTATGGQYA